MQLSCAAHACWLHFSKPMQDENKFQKNELKREEKNFSAVNAAVK
jgi:hypothetical protein